MEYTEDREYVAELLRKTTRVQLGEAIFDNFHEVQLFKVEDEGGLERIDTTSELGILLRPYHDHIIANLTPESVSYDFRGLRLFANEEARAEVLEMEIESVLTHLAEYERDMLCIVVK